MKWPCALMLCLGMALAPLQLQAETRELRIAAIAFTSSAPLFLAKELGYYEDENLEVTFQFFDAAQPIAIAVANRQAEIGATAFTAGFYNLAAKDTLRVIAAQSREEPGYRFLAYVASEIAWQHGLRRPEDLPGHSFGITQIGSSFHLMAGLLAEEKGFDIAEIELVQLERVSRMVEAIRRNDTDATILPFAQARRLENEGSARILGWVSDETPYQLGGIFTSRHMAEQERDTLRRFLRAYQRAAQDYAEAFHDSGEGALSQKQKELTALLRNYIEASPQAIREGASYIDPQGRLDVASIYRQVEWYKQEGLVDPEADPSVFLDLSFIDGHYNLPEELQQGNHGDKTEH
ncbi:ABC transporter substrate-binding protein [Fodinicurvata halophila]|uniref:ABC transporter substrate-binding protein n=1 Tax=Fodinicurvata halophila TaxID=1419723 RepID=A0ABV8UNV2_9PROT